MVRAPVTIGLPVYNGAAFLAATVESLLAQSYRDFALIISDNGSTDATEQICREFARRDSRVQYYREAVNRGASWNYNHVFNLARSKYFKWSADDDVCDKQWLIRCKQALDADDSAVIAFTQAPHIDTCGNHLGTGRDYPQLTMGEAHLRFRTLACAAGDCRPVFGLIRSDVLAKTSLIGDYDGADQVLLAELSLWGAFVEINEPLQFRRIHEEGSERCWRSKRRERQTWYSPRKRGAAMFPEWRVAYGLWEAIQRRRPDLRVRLRCYIELLRWMRWGHGRAMLDDLLFAITRRDRAAKQIRHLLPAEAWRSNSDVVQPG